jgi:hypothetical protein
MTLVRTIVAADDTVALGLLAAKPELANARFKIGATRQTAETYYMEIRLYGPSSARSSIGLMVTRTP